MVDRVEAQSEPSDFQWVRLFHASVEHLDVRPVLVGEGGIVAGPQGRTLKKNTFSLKTKWGFEYQIFKIRKHFHVLNSEGTH